jgi:hypothetical protein
MTGDVYEWLFKLHDPFPDALHLCSVEVFTAGDGKPTFAVGIGRDPQRPSTGYGPDLHTATRAAVLDLTDRKTMSKKDEESYVRPLVTQIRALLSASAATNDTSEKS